MKQSDIYTIRRYDLLGSMKQSTNPFLMDDSEFTYLKNTTANEVGSLSKDGGYSVHSNLGSNQPVDGLFTYITRQGVNIPTAISNGNIYQYTGTWSVPTNGNGVTTPGLRPSMVNYLGRVYFVTAEDEIRYTNESAVYTIAGDNGGAEIRGKYLEVLNNSLFLGHCTSVYESDTVVYTNLGDQTFYNPMDEDANTFATTANKIQVDGPITGLRAHQGSLLIFTEDATWVWNPLNQSTVQLGNIGLSSIRTVREINGILYWTNRDGVFRFNGANIPELISLPITNWSINSLWRVLDGSMWDKMAAVEFEGKYMLYVGDLIGTLPGDEEILEDVVLIYDTYRDTWSFLDNHPVSQWSRIINSEGNLRLLFGSPYTHTIYMKDYSYSHAGAAIDTRIRTKYINFGDPESDKILRDLYVTYRPEGENSRFINVSVAINGSNDYIEKSGELTPTRLTLDGLPGGDFQLERISLGAMTARAISYEFSNSDLGVDMTLLGYTQKFSFGQPNLNYST